MNDPDRTFYDMAMEEGGFPVSAGWAASGAPFTPSDDDLRRAEAAWNDPAFYDAAMAEAGLTVTAGRVPKSDVDPNRTLVPSQAELGKLPHFARDAFGARCARRVFPIVKKLWIGAPVEHLAALAHFIGVREQAAASGHKYPHSRAAHEAEDAAREAEDAAREAADEAFDAAHATNPRGGAAWDAAWDAVYTARAAHAAAEVANNPIEYAVKSTFDSLLRVVTVGTVGILTAPARDFERLVRLADKEKWTDDTPVPPSVFGPMWEGTPPPWWTDDVLADRPAPEATDVPRLDPDEA